MLSDTARHRITMLIEEMEALPPAFDKHFDFDSFFEHSNSLDDHKHVEMKTGTPLTLEALNTCGTTACALGFAGAMPEFQKLGLLHILDIYKSAPMDKPAFVSRFKVSDAWLDPFEAARVFFDIDIPQANLLFGGNNDIVINTPKEWASQARIFLDRDGDCYEYEGLGEVER